MQITFTVNDDRRALELVSSFLNDPDIDDLSIALDLVDRDDALDTAIVTGLVRETRRAQRDPLRRPFVDARADRKRDLVMRQSAIDLNEGQNRLRAEANWQRHLEAQQAMSVACPTCGVDIDEVCRSQKTHKAHSGYAHIDRIRAQAATRYGDDDTVEDFDTIFEEGDRA